MVKKLTYHWCFILLILTIGAYLIVKAVPENGWDGWRVGSAQTLLSTKHWVKNGFLNNYLLFIPQGYSKTVRYFDDPQLRQHTRGTATGGFINKKLYYTHYPFGYLLPPAILMKFGIENRFWFRFMEIIFSLTGLFFLYWAFILILKSRLAAFLGILFYSASTVFLDYADGLTASPLEELLRPLIITLSILSFKKPEWKYFNKLIWFLYFIFSISSYDSTFFIFAWLIGIDFIMEKKINFKKWLFWISAPVLAFGIQIIQNYLYLGWHDMFNDFFGAFKVQVVGSKRNFFIAHLQRWLDPFGWFFGVKWYLGILIAIVGIVIVKFLKKNSAENYNERFLYLALFATLFHFLFFPSLFFHQARAVSVFGGLLIGILTSIAIKEFSSIKEMVKKIFASQTKANYAICQHTLTIAIFVFILIFWSIQAKRTYAYIKNWPNNTWPAKKINFDYKVKNLVFGDKVIFQILGLDREITSSDRYPMAASEDEYYIGSPILGFTNTNDLINDFEYLKNRSEFPFYAVIIADQEKTMNKIIAKIAKVGFKKIPILSIIDQKFILVIPPS